MKQKLLKSIADLRFAITILLIIAVSSIIGTLIEQDQSIETYKLNYPITHSLFGFLSWDIILKFGFDHVYKTWWFVSFIIIFGISLSTCTFLQQIPSLKVARKCQFLRIPKQFYKLKTYKIIINLNLNQLFLINMIKICCSPECIDILTNSESKNVMFCSKSNMYFSW